MIERKPANPPAVPGTLLIFSVCRLMTKRSVEHDDHHACAAGRRRRRLLAPLFQSAL
jgi:hypothetical protein